MEKIIENTTNITYFYQAKQCNNIDEGTKMVMEALTLKEIEVDCIWISDTKSKSDEGNESTQFLAADDIEKIYEYVRCHNVDCVDIVGKYNQKPVVIGYNEEYNELHITIRKQNAFEVEELAKKLNFL